ncbi:MAG: glycosyltransferase family 2 protein [Clostridia bacterium]|nr:glycosyltransferase family 2 protein [Clostridia bacterium]
MYKISIIIPVYNSDKYLDDLFSSLLKQTMKFEDIQVIFVDDASTDSSVPIIRKYKEKYCNVELVELDKNHKYAGTARNEGIKYASGQYLMFSDSDDFLFSYSLEILYNKIEKENADFITANYINADYDGKVWDFPIFNMDKYKDFKLDIKDYDKSFFVLNSSVCNKIFRRDFIMKHNIRFLEATPAEDSFFTNSCFLNSKSVYYIQEPVHAYRQRNKEEKSTSFNCDIKYFKCISRTYKKIYDIFKEHSKIGFYRYTYAKNMSYMLYKFIDSTMLTYDERIEVLKDMKWFYELSITLKVGACQEAQSMIIHKILDSNYDEAINYCKLVADIRTYLPKEIRESMSRPNSDMYHNISKFDSEYEGENNV